MSCEKYRIIDASIDIETTGLYSDDHDIIEIAIVPFDNKTFLPLPSRFHQYIYPHKPENITEEAIKINRIKIEDIDKHNTPEFIKALFLDWLKLLDKEKIKLRPLGHNYSTFDIGFLKKWLSPQDYNSYFHYRVNDTCAIARFLKETNVLKIKSSKLSALCSYYKITEPPHNALGDALITLEVYKKLINELKPNKCLYRGIQYYINLIPDAVASLWVRPQ